nr:flagellar motor protein MotB [Oceanobacter mangrovi]
MLPEQDSDHHRWLLSYADFITLLCAFFIMLYAMSEIDRRQGTNLLEQLQQSLGQIATDSKSMGNDGTPVVVDATANTPAPPAAESLSAENPAETTETPLAVATNKLRQLTQLFPPDADTSIRQAEKWTSLALAGEFVFANNQYRLSPAGRQRIEQLAQALREWPYVIQVIGHSSVMPQSGFDSNWQLSAMRAASVADELVTQGVAPARLLATGVGHYHPALPSAAGWQASETSVVSARVEIVLMVSDGDEPWAAPETGAQ